MNNELQIFNNPDFGQIRVIEKENYIWFCLSDLCNALDLTQPSKVKERLNEKGVSCIPTLTAGGQQNLLYVDEANLYKTIFQSRKESAERFTDWVTRIVLPDIRKTGMYASEELLDNPDLLIAAATKLKEERAARLLAESKVKELEPKAEFYDSVAGSKDALPIGQAAKVLNMGIGQNNLFKLLREQKILMNDNKPYQEFIDRGYFRTIEQKYTKKGETHIYIKTLVYQKGHDYIRKLIQKAI